MKIVVPIHYEIKYKTKASKKVLVWMNNYRNWHHHLSNKVKQHYHDLVKAQSGDERFEYIKPHYKIYLWNRLTDWPNVRSIMEKFILDWLVEAWVINDDTVDVVLWDSSEYFIDKLNPRCEVYI